MPTPHALSRVWYTFWRLLLRRSSARRLAKVLGFRAPMLDKHRDLPPAATPAPEPDNTWNLLSPVLEDAARAFHAEHKRPAVLVLDGMDLVAKSSPAFFTTIQRFAKRCADNGWLFCVFTFSDDAAPLFADSSKSRAKTPIEIGDITDEEAVKYLTNTFSSLDAKRAGDLVQYVTGGRFALLNVHGNALAEDGKVSVDDIRKPLDRRTADVLKHDVGISATSPLFKELLAAGRAGADVSRAHDLAPKPLVKMLLREDIVAHHPNHTYTFNNCHVELFVRAKVEEEAQSKK